MGKVRLPKIPKIRVFHDTRNWVVSGITSLRDTLKMYWDAPVTRMYLDKLHRELSDLEQRTWAEKQKSVKYELLLHGENQMLKDYIVALESRIKELTADTGKSPDTPEP